MSLFVIFPTHQGWQMARHWLRQEAAETKRWLLLLLRQGARVPGQRHTQVQDLRLLSFLFLPRCPSAFTASRELAKQAKLEGRWISTKRGWEKKRQIMRSVLILFVICCFCFFWFQLPLLLLLNLIAYCVWLYSILILPCWWWCWLLHIFVPFCCCCSCSDCSLIPLPVHLLLLLVA